MKKYMVFALVIAFVAVASSAFAAQTFTTTQTTQIAGAKFVPSTSVSLNASANDTNYCVTTLHASSLNNAAGKQWAALNTASTISYLLNPATFALCTTQTALPSGTWSQ